MHHVLHFPDIKRRYFDAANRGVYPDAPMEVFDEECGWEDFWSLPINPFSYVYNVRSPKHVIVQEIGILFSSYGIAKYLYETVDLHKSDLGYAPMVEEPSGSRQSAADTPRQCEQQTHCWFNAPP